MANATQPASTTTPSTQYSNLPSKEDRATTYTANIAPHVIANSVPPPIQITKLDNQLLLLKFQCRGYRSKFIDAYQETMFKTTAYFTTFVDDTASPLQPTNLSLLTRGNTNIEAILQQLNDIWGEEIVKRLTIKGPPLSVAIR